MNDVTLAMGDDPVPWRPGLSAEHISVPILMLVSPQDEMERANPAVTREMFERIRGQKEIHEIAGGHFGLLYHPSPLFSEAQAVQTAFLRRVLLSGGL